MSQESAMKIARKKWSKVREILKWKKLEAYHRNKPAAAATVKSIASVDVLNEIFSYLRLSELSILDRAFLNHSLRPEFLNALGHLVVDKLDHFPADTWKLSRRMARYSL